MIGPPRRSTLFPYTTLFRSHRRREVRGQRLRPHAAAAVDRPPVREGAALPALLARHADDRRREHPDGNGVLRRPREAVWRDRKSTRLNSSHLVISYAVFCLT